MKKEELLKTIADGESQKVELKSSFNVEAMESVAAFANAEGGKVFIGVSNKGKIVGVEVNAESIQNWVNEIKSKTEPALLVDATQFELDGKTIVVLSVSEYPVKPIAFQGRYFKRVQNSNHLLSATEIANLSMLSLQVSWDSFPALGKTIDDLNKESVERFIGKVNTGGRLNLNGSTWLDNLRKLKLLDGMQPTNAAYLLFGKENIGYNVHLGRFKTPSMIIDDKMLNCNLFDAVEDTMRFLIAQIKVAYEITGKTTRRTEIFEYPLPALRELVLNTIVHRDYTSPMDVQIKVFDKKIVFFSPGELYGKQTVEALKTDDYVAYTRNKLIAEAFYLTGDIEKYGTGYTRVRNEIAAYPTMKFEFEEKPSAWLVTISYEERKTDEKGELATEHATKLSQLVPNLSVQVKILIMSLKDGEKSATELLLVPELVQAYSGKSPVYFKKRVIYPAIELGLVAMLYPDKPKHPKQKYYLTEKGREVLKALE